MKAVALTGIGQMELQEMAKPIIEKDTDVLLKVEKMGICGSDVHYYKDGKIGSQVVQYPYLVGHECSGIVEEVGSDVSRVKVGDEVVIEPAVSCHKCPQCLMGRYNTCYNGLFLGTPGQGNGCLCEYIVMPEENCLPNEGITLEEGAMCEPFTIAVYAVGQGLVSKDSTVAILGAGPIGLSCLVAARAEGTETVYMTDRLGYRKEFAKKHGAAWAGNPEEEDVVEAILSHEQLGVDVVLECAGEQSTLDEAVELLRPGGRLVVVGIPRLDRISFNIDKLRRKEIKIVNVRRQNKCAEKAIGLIAGGKAKVDFMVTHRFKIEEAKEAFDMVADYHDGVIKAMISL